MNPFDELANRLYGPPDMNAVSAIRESADRVVNRLQQYGAQIVNSVQATMDNYISDEAIQRAYDVYRKFTAPVRSDVIKYDRDFIDPPNLYTMGVIMANPEIRNYYEDGEIDGFSGYDYFYEDDLGNPEDSIIYNNVYSGVVTTDDDNKEPFLYADSSDYHFNIEDTWEVLDMWHNYLDNLPDDDVTEVSSTK